MQDPIFLCSWVPPPPLPLMEGRRRSLFAFLLLLVLVEASSRPHHQLHSDPISSQSPTPSSPASTPIRRSHSEIRRILLGVLLGSLTGFLASLLLLLSLRLFFLCAGRAPLLNGPVIFSPNISPKTLQLALSHHALSQHSNYFPVALDHDLVVAVKLLDSSTPTSNSLKRRAQRDLEVLARVKHRNVMSLRAYVRNQEQLWLVYDYIAGGSLEDAMKRVRAQQLELGWEARHRIAVGVVKGLRYLHFECSPRMVHYSLKPTNVMLDQGLEPKLGGCGLAKLLLLHTSFELDAAAAAAAAATTTTTCYYIAPECLQSCRYTDKSDIFSFGVILGELLTGRDPCDPLFAGDSGRGSLGRWLRQLQQAGEAREALDKSIVGEQGEEEEMLMAIRIALVCLSDLPADRPSSDELVAMLTQLHSF